MTDYTSPSTRSNNFLVDEDVYNDEIINNIKHLYEATNNVAYITDEKAAGTDGGTATSGSWQTRTLNTKVDPNSIVTLASNQITLAAGTYELRFSGPARGTGAHQTRFWNVTDGTLVCAGSSAHSRLLDTGGDTIDQFTRSEGGTRFTIAAQKTFELQHQVNATRATTGWGSAANFGIVEVYSIVVLRKVA